MIHFSIHKKLHGAQGDMELSLQCEIRKGEFVALMGESGSGKTTLLRILAGLERDVQATIKVADTIWQDTTTFLPPQKRQIGFVFQDYALFENMTVEQNLLYVTPNTKLANHLLHITALDGLKSRFPHTLSGGQKQRVSIARAMMKEPKLLLLDEPLSALDPSMREKLQKELLTLHKEFGTTTIMVSHDPSEIYKLSSRVIELHQGKIIKDANAKEVLMQTNGSQKCSLNGEVLAIEKRDVEYVVTVAIGKQIVEVVLSEEEAKPLQVSHPIKLSTKALSPFVDSIEF